MRDCRATVDVLIWRCVYNTHYNIPVRIKCTLDQLYDNSPYTCVTCIYHTTILFSFPVIVI